MIRFVFPLVALVMVCCATANAENKLTPDVCEPSRVCAMHPVLLQSKKEAVVKQAAERSEYCALQGHPYAAFVAGFAYEFGKGVKHDLQKSFEYFRMAANGGVTPAMAILIDFYNGAMGAEFKSDLSECYAWSQVAKKLGDQRTAGRETLCRGLTDAHREAGSKRSEQLHQQILERSNSKLVSKCAN